MFLHSLFSLPIFQNELYHTKLYPPEKEKDVIVNPANFTQEIDIYSRNILIYV